MPARRRGPVPMYLAVEARRKEVNHRVIVTTGNDRRVNEHVKETDKMKIMALSLMAIAVCVLASGCASNMFPGGPTPAGALVTNVKSPAQAVAVATDASATFSKCGTASAGAVLGLFAFGDASVDAAMKNAGIKKVHHVDHQINSFLLGLWVQDTTLVYGE
jgi:hypothetical protein